MSLTDLRNPSSYWPWIKLIAKPLNIPGTSLGLEMLTELQDDLADDQFQDKVKAMLEVIYLRTAEIAQRLQADDGISVEEDALRTATQGLAEELYLRQVAAKFFYADFKGIEQQSKFVSMPLDAVFVDLKASPEDTAQKRSSEELELHDRLAHADEKERQAIVLQLEEFDTKRATTDSSNNIGVDAILNGPGAVVLLGGPGSGKTTLVKRLARSCALGSEQLRQRYPQMPWCFPLILPMTQFDTERAGRSLIDYAEAYMLDRGGEALLARFREHLLNGRVLFLCDGLDEIADTGGRIASARAVDDAINGLGRNRLLLTSRRVGYAICRLTVPADHYVLLPFTREDVATFSRQWHRAYEQVIHPEHPDLVGAAKEAESLIKEIRGNSSVELLAKNPLMLTIIALIKHQNKVLPDRRVELYELALKTLVASWNLARSLSDRPAGKAHGSYEQTRDLWAAVAYWMHETANREVSRDKLQSKLEEVLVQEFDHSTFEAKGIAESYLLSATETSGLLEARGPNTFAFVHQSFQEYLAAMHLARPAARAASRIKPLSHDPRWTEVIRLAAGHLGVTAGEKEALAELIGALLDCPDPLEPILGVSLRLALGCLEDNVGVRAGQTDAILARTASHLKEDTELVDRLPKLVAIPGSISEPLFLDLLNHSDWRVRMESLRLLARINSPSTALQTSIKKIFAKDEDPDVKGHAAWALWRHRWLRDASVFSAIAYALARPAANFSLAPEPDLLKMAIELLGGADAELRLRSLALSRQWGPQETLRPSLVKLLESRDSYVRLGAAQTLGQWGQQEIAQPALINLLEDPDPYVRLRAAETLGQWGQQEIALPVLVKVLEDSESRVRLIAVRALGQWGPKETALPALVKLLEDPDTNVQLTVAQTLVQWGLQETLLPPLVKLLENPNFHVRLTAAQTLGEWRKQEFALPTLIKSVEDPDSSVRLRAVQILGQWGPQESALPALVKSLKDSEVSVWVTAVQALRQWGQQQIAVPSLMELLEHPSSTVRFIAAENLGQSGQQEVAVSALIEMLEDNPSSTNAARALREQLINQPVWVNKLLLSVNFKADCEVIEALRREDGRVVLNLDQRKKLANLLASLPSDSPIRKSVRQIIHEAVREIFASSP